MAETSKMKRKPAPTVESILASTDERTKLINEHTKLDDAYAYKFHKHDVKDSELEANGYEKVVVDGDVVHHNGDPLIRREKKLDDGVRHGRQNQSYELVKDKLQRANAQGNLTQKAKAKVPIVRKTDDN